MNDEIRKLQQLKQIADLIRAAEEHHLADARRLEQDAKDQVTALWHHRTREVATADGIEDAAALAAWMSWSQAQIGAGQSHHARCRAELEMRMDRFRVSFGRSSAITDLLDRALIEKKRKRGAP